MHHSAPQPERRRPSHCDTAGARKLHRTLWKSRDKCLVHKGWKVAGPASPAAPPLRVLGVRRFGLAGEQAEGCLARSTVLSPRLFLVCIHTPCLCNLGRRVIRVGARGHPVSVARD